MCITDDEVLDDMKKNEAEKAEVEALKTPKRMEREEKKREKEKMREKKKEREDGKENERLENKTNCEKAAAIEIKQKG